MLKGLMSVMHGIEVFILGELTFTTALSACSCLGKTGLRKSRSGRVRRAETQLDWEFTITAFTSFTIGTYCSGSINARRVLR